MATTIELTQDASKKMLFIKYNNPNACCRADQRSIFKANILGADKDKNGVGVNLIMNNTQHPSVLFTYNDDNAGGSRFKVVKIGAVTTIDSLQTLFDELNILLADSV